MATHILIRKVPVSGSTFSLIFLYGKSHTPYSSYFVCGEDHSLLIHKKYEACDFSVLTFPKMIQIKKAQKYQRDKLFIHGILGVLFSQGGGITYFSLEVSQGPRVHARIKYYLKYRSWVGNSGEVITISPTVMNIIPSYPLVISSGIIISICTPDNHTEIPQRVRPMAQTKISQYCIIIIMELLVFLRSYT